MGKQGQPSPMQKKLLQSLISCKKGTFSIHFAWAKLFPQKTWTTVSNVMCVSNTAFGIANHVEQQLQGQFFVNMTSLLEHGTVQQSTFYLTKLFPKKMWTTVSNFLCVSNTAFGVVIFEQKPEMENDECSFDKFFASRKSIFAGAEV